VVDKKGSLARIDPASGALRQTIKVPSGSYNPFYSEGRIWVTRAEGSEITSVDAATGAVLGTVRTGPGPRFLTAGAGAVWTLNQGDGTLTRVPTASNQSAKTVALGTPGHGGDISFGLGMVWTTMVKVPLSVVDATTTTLLCQWSGPGRRLARHRPRGHMAHRLSWGDDHAHRVGGGDEGLRAGHLGRSYRGDVRPPPFTLEP
jgi:virginiamycin B lyase